MSGELLATIWFFLWGLLWAIYFSLDGFDLGAGMLAGLWRGERDAAIGSLGPFWDGNEVWLITAGGVTFAAFPALYATMFSALYAPLFIILLALVFRVVAIEFYHQSDHPGWRRLWAAVLAAGSLLVALLFGVAFGNIFQGLPLDAGGYHGTLLSLLNPFALLTGLLFVLAFLHNGAAWLAHKGGGEMRALGSTWAGKLWWAFLMAAGLFLLATPFSTSLLDNYLRQPALFIVPLLSVACLVAAKISSGRKAAGKALVYGSLAVFFLVLSGVIGLFPNMLPSSLDPAAGLTAFNAAGSKYTLRLMLGVTVLFLPLVLLYQVWLYRLFAPEDGGRPAGY